MQHDATLNGGFLEGISCFRVFKCEIVLITRFCSIFSKGGMFPSFFLGCLDFVPAEKTLKNSCRSRLKSQEIHWESSLFSGNQQEINFTRPGYVKIAIENGHRNSEFSHF
jgi:hypothetical protein